MKNIFLSIVCCFFADIIFAQNVGINDPVPSAKLSVKGAETTPDGQAATIKIQNTAPGTTNAWYLRAGATGNNTPNGGFSISDNTAYRFNITSTGNIGIGTTIPSEQLTLQSGNISLLSSTKGILLNGFDGPMINRGFDPFTTGSLAGLGRWGLFMEPNNLTIGIPAIALKAFAISSYNNNSTINKQLFRVSVDAAATNALVEVNGAMKIEGLNTVEFGAGIAGKEFNAGKIGYNSFGPQGLSIIGSGTTALNRKVYVFAEGGTTFNGPIDVGGSTGIAGQVLTSNGSAAPSWNNAAYSNNIRFAVDFTKNINFYDDAVIFSTRYNLNPADVVIGSESITLNQSGLYHFDIRGEAVLNIAGGVSVTPTIDFALNYNSFSYSIISTAIMQPKSTANDTWKGAGKESLEIYITAPATIRFPYRLLYVGPPTPTPAFAISGYLTGHLISE